MCKLQSTLLAIYTHYLQGTININLGSSIPTKFIDIDNKIGIQTKPKYQITSDLSLH